MKTLSHARFVYKNMSPKKKLVLKTKAALTLYAVASFLYGNYAFLYGARPVPTLISEQVLGLAQTVVLASGGVTEKTVFVEKQVPVLDADLAEQVAARVSQEAKEGIDQSIKANLGKR